MGRCIAPTAKRVRPYGRWHLALLAVCGAIWCCVRAASLSADDPAATADSVYSEEQRNHWAFQPIQRPAVPAVQNEHQVRTPIDAFILRELEAHGLSISTPAEKRTLLRRVTFDLTGLPPTPDEMGRFLSDSNPDALDRVVDRLLASPHYGETWARHWLDVVRYADTAGYNHDPPRPFAYKYRDYVVQSLNANKPYDRFLQEQIAGDELFPDQADALIATGYNRMWPDESNASDVLLARQDALNDLTSNVGSAILGLSVGCAQCHDHKFDPISQRDYYRLQAFFAGIVPAERVAVGTPDELDTYHQQLAEWIAATDSIRTEIYATEAAIRAQVPELKGGKFPPVVLQAVDVPPEHRTAYQHQLAFWTERNLVEKRDYLLKGITEEQKQRLDQLRKELEEHASTKPKPPLELEAMATIADPSGSPPTYRLTGGNYEKPAEQVSPGIPEILADSDRCECESGVDADTKPRAALARWLASPDNPLPARVMVNRIWQEHFGAGLVENANDLGFQTPEPFHKDLLNWLASEFAASGFDVKAMHRLIISSAVYQQSTRFTPDEDSPGEEDPRLYAYYPRRRLTAEALRDSMLAVAGELNTSMCGPGVRPELPHGYEGAKWKVSEGADCVRRSVYIYAKRNLPYPLLQTFDFPDMHENCACRPSTTVAPQALMLLNDELVFRYATSFAERLFQETPGSRLEPLVAKAYDIAFARPVNAEELQAALSFIRSQEQLFEDADQSAEESAEAGPIGDANGPRVAAVRDFCHVLLNANEFIYLD